MLKILENQTKRLAIILAVAGGAAVVLMLVQINLDVILSNTINKPIQGNLEVVSVYYMVMVVFLPAAFVELKDESIVVDLLFFLLPDKLQAALLVLGDLLTTTFFALLSYRSFLDFMHSFATSEVHMGSHFIMVWPAKGLLPLGFAAAGVFVLVRAANRLHQKKSK